MKPLTTTPRNGIIALNVLFIGILAAVTLTPPSEAINVEQNRYIALPTAINGLPTGAVYIMDTSNKEMVAVTYDANNKRITTLGYRNLAYDASTVSSN